MKKLQFNQQDEYGEEENEQELRHHINKSNNRNKVYKKFRVRVFLEMCKYNVIHDLCAERRWKCCGDADDWNLFWYDWNVAQETYNKMLAYQKINHFPGMEQITRKDTLARNMNRCRKQYSQLYDFYPQTYYLPNDESEFLRDFDPRKEKIYISKPCASCQGKGIKLFNSIDQIDIKEPQVIQHYLSNPYLIDGFKFDLRLYVIVLQVLPYPLILEYTDGMARLCTIPYEQPTVSNLDQVCMHLTNYALNKKNDNFQFNKDDQDDSTGSKQALKPVLERLTKDGCDVDKLQADIRDIYIKTIFGILPNLQHSYLSSRPGVPKFLSAQDPFDSQEIFFGSNCFEVLGFDIMIDANFKPWLIEVNHSPSFTCDTPLDLRIKETLLSGVLDLLNISQKDKQDHQQIQKETSLKRLYGTQYDKIQTERSKKSLPKPAFKFSTYRSVHAHYQNQINKLRIFQQIYPLQTGENDIYRQILLGLKNPFITEQAIKNMNQVVPSTLQHKQALEQQINNNQLIKMVKRPKSAANIQKIRHNENASQPSLTSEQTLRILLQKMNQEAEFGTSDKQVAFQGYKGVNLLPQGISRNMDTEKLIQEELNVRKKALFKYGVVDQICNLIDED
ncbi:Tubulin_tyrosine ligase [Hexamita inflata]|uniref:Tubulin tyrosine ligase n=1 Tax=Hexamita inflata TaxID=28002 RepID=A0AA86TIH0_9EUKA|nr:Tubulin tyrosine ligase [Hexamita inflata]